MPIGSLLPVMLYVKRINGEVEVHREIMPVVLPTNFSEFNFRLLFCIQRLEFRHGNPFFHKYPWLVIWNGIETLWNDADACRHQAYTNPTFIEPRNISPLIRTVVENARDLIWINIEEAQPPSKKHERKESSPEPRHTPGGNGPGIGGGFAHGDDADRFKRTDDGFGRNGASDAEHRAPAANAFGPWRDNTQWHSSRFEREFARQEQQAPKLEALEQTLRGVRALVPDVTAHITPSGAYHLSGTLLSAELVEPLLSAELVEPERTRSRPCTASAAQVRPPTKMVNGLATPSDASTATLQALRAQQSPADNDTHAKDRTAQPSVAHEKEVAIKASPESSTAGSPGLIWESESSDRDSASSRSEAQRKDAVMQTPTQDIKRRSRLIVPLAAKDLDCLEISPRKKETDRGGFGGVGLKEWEYRNTRNSF